MAQALHLINGPGVNQKISAKGGLIDKLLSAKKGDAEIVEELYLDCFGRFPSAVEKSAVGTTARKVARCGESGPRRVAAARIGATRTTG